MPVVDIKGVGKAQFPDEMPINDIKTFLRNKYSGSIGNVKRFAEPIGTVLTASLAEPIAGVAGIADSIIRGTNSGADTVKSVKEALTYLPKSSEGKEGIEWLSDKLSPIGEAISDAENNLGDKVLNATGSPALAAIAHSVPTVFMEAIGLKSASIIKNPISTEDLYTNKIFAGALAKNADLGALNKAKEMEGLGTSRDEIWSETGWFNDRGDWKFEIDDSGSKVDLTPSQNALKRGAPHSERFPFVGENVEHREILGYQDSAYDDLDTIRSQLTGKTTKGGLYGQSKALEESINPKGEFIELSDDFYGEDGKSVMLHELQHAIQQREGFAKGGSPDFVKVEDYPSIVNRFEREYGNLPQVKKNKAEMGENEYRQWAVDMYANSKPAGMHDLAHENYQRLAGEAEARLVQTRMNMTPEQRRAKPPWLDLDVPEDELIYRGGNGGISLSTNNTNNSVDDFKSNQGKAAAQGDKLGMGVGLLGAVPVLGDAAKKTTKWYHGGKGVKKILSRPPNRGNLGAFYLTDSVDVANNYAIAGGSLYGKDGQVIKDIDKLKEAVQDKGRLGDYDVSEYKINNYKPLNVDSINYDDVIETIGRDELDSIVDRNLYDYSNKWQDSMELDDFDLEMEIDNLMEDYTTEDLGGAIEYDAKLIEDADQVFRLLARDKKGLEMYLNKKKSQGYNGLLIDVDPESGGKTLVAFNPNDISRNTNNSVDDLRVSND